MRRVLSTYLFVEQRLTTALLDRVAGSGIEEIELFCARQHLDYRNGSQLDELRHWLADSPMRVASMHAPSFSDEIWGVSGPNAVLSITALEKAHRIRATDELKRAIEVADAIPFRYLVMHVGDEEEEYEPAKIDAAFNALDELRVFGSQLGVEILLENAPGDLSSAARLNTLLELTHLPLGYCFDVGHAQLGLGVESEFEKMNERIRSTHVHDNDGSEDAHLFPPAGEIDWERTMPLLRSVGDDVPLLLEPRGDESIEDPLGEAQRSFDALENL